MNVMHLSRRKSSGVNYKVESIKLSTKSREDSKETRIKKYEPIMKSVKKMTNLKDYQNKGTASSKKLRETKSNTFSNYIKNPIEPDPKSKINRKLPESNLKLNEKQKPLKDEADDDDEDDVMIFSERPNEQIPVPHQMSTINQKSFLEKGKVKKEVSKNTETLSYNESNQDLTYQDDYSFKTYSKEKSRYHGKEETPDMLTKISTPHEEEKLETPESIKGTYEENKELKDRYFISDSASKNCKVSRDNDIFEITIDPKINERNKINEINKSKSSKQILNKVVEIEHDAQDIMKMTERDEYEHFEEVEEHFVAEIEDQAPARKRNSLSNADTISMQKCADDSRDSKQNCKHK